MIDKGRYDYRVQCPECLHAVGVHAYNAELQLIAAHSPGQASVRSKKRPRCPGSDLSALTLPRVPRAPRAS